MPFISAMGFAILAIFVTALISNGIGLGEAIVGAQGKTSGWFIFGIIGAVVGQLLAMWLKIGTDFGGFYLPFVLLMAMVFMFVVTSLILS